MEVVINFGNYKNFKTQMILLEFVPLKNLSFSWVMTVKTFAYLKERNLFGELKVIFLNDDIKIFFNILFSYFRFLIQKPVLIILTTTPIKAMTKNIKVISKQSLLGLL
jgi:hypothetical protein